ncbi:ABC transporter substrate-binding protein [Clostridium peptidivorans]|uniref:ABC transporter substrate-binding protein n=1 Tax=Clostridium peptidivorans TaxID=100174 RepID=UPI000BE45FC8|nr:ABC transporter substrate-binding protein [Clostridium peptidivorans]
MKFKKVLVVAIASVVLTTSVVGCGKKAEEAGKNEVKQNISVEELTNFAKKEGQVVSVGMPDSWANWKGTWNDIKTKYSVNHIGDTDLSSAEIIAKYEAEKKNATADIGDIGAAFAPIAVEKGITLPYKTSHWNSVPDWAKDKDGNWMIAYTGTMAILTNKATVKNPPKSFKDILNGDYKVTIDDVAAGNQSQMSVLAAAKAFGGDENNIKPGLDFFAKLAKQGRLVVNKNDLASVEKGEVQVTLVWDFNGLGYRDKIDPNRFNVCIPAEGSISTGYTTIINKYAPHPYSAMLTREYIFSDEGQINLARGFAKPVREDVKLPEDVKAKLLPAEAYKNVKPVNYAAWTKTKADLPQLWQEQVLVNIK